MNGSSLSAAELEQLGAGVILDSLADGAYITDRERRIVFWNQAAERITGWTRSDVVGHSCHENILVHVDKDNHCLCGHAYCPLHRAMVTGERSSAPMLVFAQTKVGGRVPVEVMVSPIRNAGGAVIGGIEIFRDLSDAMNDLRRARVIQQHALDAAPVNDDRLTVRVRYVPQELVGGDFYRVEALDEDRYAVLVADVSGHGLSSALYTMQLRTLWEEFRPLLHDPASFLAALNHRVHLFANRDDHFATALYAVVDAARGEFRWASAGHPSALFVPGPGADPHFERLPGQALGLVAGATYRQNTRLLAVDEAVLLYTDGAVEVFNACGEELGEEGLRRLVARHDLRAGEPALEKIEEALLLYSNNVRLCDDLTLLVVQRRAAGAPPDRM